MLEEHPPANCLHAPKDDDAYTRVTARLPLNHKHKDSHFQKNYPKNLFIPMLEYLAEVGLKTQYEAAVGTRSFFEGKNVVSLTQIHQLMSQDWFQLQVSRDQLIASMANRILMNSKIKKKLFHLTVAQKLYTLPLDCARQFKKVLSQQANQIGRQIQETDELFQFPSATIYLLHLFSKTLISRVGDLGGLVESAPSQHSMRSREEDNSMSGSEESRNKGVCSSKQEYKFYLKRIIDCFNYPEQNTTEFFNSFHAVTHAVTQSATQFRINHKLVGAPSWEHFNTLVVKRCYDTKRKGHKLIHSSLTDWIIDFKKAVTRNREGTQPTHRDARPVPQETSRFEPIILVQPQLYCPQL